MFEINASRGSGSFLCKKIATSVFTNNINLMERNFSPKYESLLMNLLSRNNP